MKAGVRAPKLPQFGARTTPSPGKEHHVTLHTRLANEHAQTMAEYAVVLGVITLGVIAALGLLTGTISDAFKATLSLIP